MKKIAIFTTTRADFGLFAPLIVEIKKSNELSSLLFAGGTHFSAEYGQTINEIENNGYEIDDSFDYLINKYDSYSHAKGLSIATKKVADIFAKHDFDFVCLLGDRYELLSIVSNAIIFKKAIIHLYGGEISQGAIDEQIRHMITKAAHLHLTSSNEYAENICKMGEAKWRVYNVGALGIDNIVKSKKIAKKILFADLGLNEGKPVAIMTYHPVTLEFKISPQKQIQNVFSALEGFDINVLITSPNCDLDRDKIKSIIKKKVNKNQNYIYIDSLGAQKYLNLIPHCEFVIGNSSSGIIEVPFFRIPTINIGDRQRGRIRHESIIDTAYSINSIKDGIQRALSKDFKAKIKKMPYKFGDGYAAEKAVSIIQSVNADQTFLRKTLKFTC